MNKKNALIIFARKPELGRVKTRLAANIGDEKALDIYKRLLQHTRQISNEVNELCDRYTFVTAHDNDSFWEGFNIELQYNGDLGERMQHAFELLLGKGYEQVVIIGSDCPGLTAADIGQAFYRLADNDIVIGPTFDGGYYLLGMKKMYPTLFSDKAWSTEVVYQQTLVTIAAHQLTYTALKKMSDVDEVEDVPQEWL